MSVLMEWYDSGSAPHEALGRAARKLSRGGALYLGGGIGVEKRSTPKGDEYNVASAAGSTTETFTGPLSAAMRGYSLAGASTEASTPGGATTIGDPAVAARVAELSERLRSTQQDIERYQRRLARAKAQQASQPYSPVSQPSSIADDDRWEQRQIAELQVEQQQIEAERALLLAGSGLSEVEQARPGTNFTKVPPKNVAKLRPIIDHYKGMAHPFTACVRDQVKHGLSQDHANRRCAVVKDLGAGTTKWRKGAKSGKVAEEVLEAALGRVVAIEEACGVGSVVMLVEQGAPPAPRLMSELCEMATNDLALLAWAEHPLGLLVFPLSEFEESKVKRDVLGRFAAKVGALKAGESADLADGTRVVRAPTPEPKFYVHGVGKGGGTTQPTTATTAQQAAKRALDVSAQSEHPKSIGGTTTYARHEDAVKAKGDQTQALGEKPPAKAKGGLRGRPDLAGGGSAPAGTSRSGLAAPGAARQSGIDSRRRRVPGGTATRQEATAASRAVGGGGERTATVAGKTLKVGDTLASGERIAAIDESGRVAIAPAAADVGMVAGNRNRVASQQWYSPTSKILAAKVKRTRGPSRVSEAEAPAGVGMLVEAFASSSGAGGVGTRPDLVAQRQVKRDQASGKLPKPKSSKPSSSSSGGSADSKHPRGHKGTPVGGRFVAKGSSGEDVRAVQRRVGAKPDGKFGTQTRSAVMEFQKAHGLQVDGVIGHQTATALAGHFDAAKTAQVGALKGSDHSKLKAMRRGSSGRSGTVGPRRRGGVVV